MNRDFTTTMIIGLFLLTSSITLHALNNPRTEGFIGKTVHDLERILFSHFPTNLSSTIPTTTYTKITACDGTGVIVSSDGVPDATNAEGTQDASYASLHETVSEHLFVDLTNTLPDKYANFLKVLDKKKQTISSSQKNISLPNAALHNNYQIEMVDSNADGVYDGSVASVLESNNTIILEKEMNKMALPSNVSAFAIQPSCDDGMAQSDGYLQISEVTNADRYHFSLGNTFDDNGGANTYANATTFTTFPEQTTANLGNPTGSEDYTIRIYDGSDAEFIDVVVIMNEQDCIVGCECNEAIYLNEVTGGGAIHKYIANPDGTLSEISSPWLDNTALGEDFTNPHGLGTDLNGFLYINTRGRGDIRKVSSIGVPVAGFALDVDSYNIDSYNNILYTNRQNGYIQSYDLCTGLPLCRIYLDGLNTIQNWGLDIVDNYLYATSNIGQSSDPSIQAEPNYLWKIDLDQNSCADIANPIAPFLSSTGTFGIGNSVLGQTSIYGVTTDANGNIYVIERDRRDEEPTVPELSARLLKYSSNGVLLAISNWDIEEGTNPHPGFVEPNRGYFNAIGIIYSAVSNRLYVSTGSPEDDCVAMFDVNLNYLGAAIPWTGTGVDNAKAIAINKECCPVSNNMVIDTTLCNATLNEVILLHEILDCQGIIAEGEWTAVAGSSGINFETCDNSITITSLDACGTFILESDGIGANVQCGAFKITVNIEVGDITAPVIAGSNPTCVTSNDPAALTFTSAASGTSTITYQWQVSTTDCMSGWSDIAGAPTDNTPYDPPVLTQETHYRVLTIVDEGCSSGMCRDTSNCVTLTPESGCTPTCTNPIATAFAIQPSCVDNVVQSDGYLQLSAVTNGDKVNFSTGSTYTGDADYANATTIGALPFQFNTGLSNPSVSQDYTIRVFNGASDCFTDVVITLNMQDCIVGCECNDFIYLNDDFGTNNQIHKFSINSSTGQATEIGNPWIDNIINPHGITGDLNGFLYFTELQTGPLRTERVYKADCAGTIISSNVFSDEILNGDIGVTTNMASIGNVVYMNDAFVGRINAFDVCKDTLLGTVALTGVTSESWGMNLGRDNYIYATSNRGINQAIHQVYKIDPDLSNFTTPATTINPLFTFDVSTYPGQSSGGQVAGITTDENQNIYVVSARRGDRQATIIKFDQAGNVLGTISDIDNNGTGFYGAIGIAYSEESGLLYLTSTEDCISVVDPTTMTEIPSLSIPGGQAKGLSIISECCPTNNNITIDTTLCVATIGEVLFLQELINCDGIICEGLWAEGSNTGMTYDACDNSVTIDALNACGSFTLESDGTGNNPQCGAFKIEVNISVNVVTASVVAADQTICLGDDPAAFTVTTPATGGTLTYQWQSSTTDCTTDFSDIGGATNATYDPPAGLTDTTYYRVIVNSANAGCASGNCADTSNCITVTVLDTMQTILNQDICQGDSHAFNGQNLNVTGTYRDTLMAANGCDSFIVLTLNVLDTMQTISADTICSGEPYTFNGQTLITTGTYRDTLMAANGCDSFLVLNFVVQACDWGDLPDTSAMTNAGDYQTTRANNGPVHVIIPGLSLGAIVDGETDGQPSADALGDENDEKDEDGLTIFPSLDIKLGSTFRLPLTVTNTTGDTAYVEAWIDWNGDGDFDDANEMVVDLKDNADGNFPSNISMTVPANATNGLIGVRIRVSHTDNMTPYGQIGTGEVEDYLIGIECPSIICIPVTVDIRRQ